MAAAACQPTTGFVMWKEEAGNTMTCQRVHTVFDFSTSNWMLVSGPQRQLPSQR